MMRDKRRDQGRFADPLCEQNRGKSELLDTGKQETRNKGRDRSLALDPQPTQATGKTRV